jgi:polysaccharide export outer membrane protein
MHGRIFIFVKSLITPVIAATILVLAGCANDPPPLQTTSAVTVLDTPSLPEPAAARGAATLGPLDKVQIEVFGVENLEREIQVDAGGRLSFPFAGSIDVAGRTPDEVARIIEDRLRQGYIKEPVVTVNLLDTASQTVAVEGAVEKPGVYPAAGRLSLLRTLAMAGGDTDLALREQVVIFREVDGMRYAGVYNLDALRRGLVPDPRVYANDTVVLGESPRRKSIDRIIKLAPALTSPVILLLTRL